MHRKRLGRCTCGVVLLKPKLEHSPAKAPTSMRVKPRHCSWPGDSDLHRGTTGTLSGASALQKAAISDIHCPQTCPAPLSSPSGLPVPPAPQAPSPASPYPFFHSPSLLNTLCHLLIYLFIIYCLFFTRRTQAGRGQTPVHPCLPAWHIAGASKCLLNK